jgi:hypothetical protein
VSGKLGMGAWERHPAGHSGPDGPLQLSRRYEANPSRSDSWPGGDRGRRVLPERETTAPIASSLVRPSRHAPGAATRWLAMAREPSST